MSDLESRFAARDRIWLGVTNIQLVSVPEPLDLGQMQERIRALATAEPGLRFFTQVPPDRPDRHVDATTAAQALARSENLVQPLGGTDLQSAADAVAALLDADRGFPAPAVYVGAGLVGHRFPHVFGDGLSAVTHLRRLAAGPETPGKGVPPWPAPGDDRPLVSALAHRYRRDPKRLLAELRAPRPKPAPSGEEPDAQAPQSVQVLFRQLDAARMNELKEWRAEHAPGVSTMSVVVAALRRGLAREGVVPAADGLYMVYDLRSYLPPKTRASGNFISASWLEPTDPLSASSVNDAVREGIATGRPLLGLAVGAGRLLPSRRSRLRPGRSASVHRDVAFSHMRVSSLLPARVLAKEGGPTIVMAAAAPGSIGSITYTLVEVGPQMSVTAVFCSPFTPREEMTRVLDDLSRSPAALLA